MCLEIKRVIICFFFFSSRRRHTRWTGDWSSDVCSSDLNAAAISGLVDFVFRTPAAKRYCVLTVPGDRRDDDIREAGRLCAGFDRVILKEDIDRRGRGRGEIA